MKEKVKITLNLNIQRCSPPHIEKEHSSSRQPGAGLALTAGPWSCPAEHNQFYRTPSAKVTVTIKTKTKPFCNHI